MGGLNMKNSDKEMGRVMDILIDLNKPYMLKKKYTDLKQAHTAIINGFKDMLPEKKDKYYFEHHMEMDAYNNCLDEIIRRLG